MKRVSHQSATGKREGQTPNRSEDCAIRRQTLPVGGKREGRTGLMKNEPEALADNENFSIQDCLRESASASGSSNRTFSSGQGQTLPVAHVTEWKL